jgi:hypothetical protein
VAAADEKRPHDLALGVELGSRLLSHQTVLGNGTEDLVGLAEPPMRTVRQGDTIYAPWRLGVNVADS